MENYSISCAVKESLIYFNTRRLHKGIRFRDDRTLYSLSNYRTDYATLFLHGAHAMRGGMSREHHVARLTLKNQ